jgi:dCMP deaminase
MNKRTINFYMAVADTCASMSRAVRLKVGAVVVKNGNIIAHSWNGTPSGWDNNCEDIEWCRGGGWLSAEEIELEYPYSGTYLDGDGNSIQGRYRLKTKPHVLHAESNAVVKLAREQGGADGSTLFVTHAPCMECSKLIHQSGVRHVYYRTAYRNTDGVEFLTTSGVVVEQVGIEP